MKVFGDWLIVPIALLTLVSGLVLSLGTPWGLARHRWVHTKFWLTLAAAIASAFALRPSIDRAAADAAVYAASDLVVAPSVALAVYVFTTAISVLKPWGPTARGRKHLTALRKALDSEKVHETA